MVAAGKKRAETSRNLFFTDFISADDDSRKLETRGT